jgi:hypothetical protein
MKLFALLAFLPLCCAAAQPEAVFPLTPYRKTVAIEASVGGVKGKFAFDTGAGLTVLDPAFAKRTGCRQRQRIVGFQMMGKRGEGPYCEDLPVLLGDGSWKTSAGTVGMEDLDKLFGAKIEPIAGILGLDIFEGRTITIDFPAQRLIVESAASALERALPANELPARLTREMQGRTLSVSVALPTAEGKVWMELDSGNGGTLLISQPYAHLFGLDPKQDKPQKLSFTLPNGMKLESDMAFTPDMIIDGNIGMPFLKNVVLTLDLRAGRVWIARPAAGAL